MKLVTKKGNEMLRGTRVLLKCSVTVHCKPELMVGDAVIEIVSLVIIGMIRYRKIETRWWYFITRSKICTIIVMSDISGVAVRKTLPAKNYGKQLTEPESLRAR